LAHTNLVLVQQLKYLSICIFMFLTILYIFILSYIKTVYLISVPLLKQKEHYYIVSLTPLLKSRFQNVQYAPSDVSFVKLRLEAKLTLRSRTIMLIYST
jgi:hypothetical protein